MRRTFNLVMRVVSSLLGLIMMAMGSIWMMQGLGIGPSAILQGFMVNDVRWTLYGAILALFGLGQIVWSNTRQPAS
jgi:ABC-type lipoprotein release transport system permease subunit